MMDGRPRPLLPEVGVLGLVPDPWASVWTPRHHVVSRLARFYRVAYVDPAVPWRTAWRGPSPDPNALTASAPPAGLRVHTAERWLPQFHRPRLARLVGGVRWRRARTELRRHGCRRIVLYLWRPTELLLHSAV